MNKDTIAIITDVIKYQSARWRHLGPQEIEDMSSMAWVTVLERLPRFDDTRCKLRTFVEHCVISSNLDWYRRFYKPRTTTGEDLDYTRALFNAYVQERSDRVYGVNVDDHIIMRELMEILEPRQVTIVSMYLAGDTLLTIAQALGITESRVSQMMTTIIGKMKKYERNPTAKNSKG